MNDSNATPAAEPTKLSPAAARPFRGLLHALEDAPVTLMALGLDVEEAHQIGEKIKALTAAIERHFED